MKVKEAIEQLKEFNPELELFYFEIDYNYNSGDDKEEFWSISCFREKDGKVIIILD